MDNIFLEVQDVQREQLMYLDAITLGEMDAALSEHNFTRMFCEENFGVSRGPPIRELNCLWTRTGRPPLWVSGQSSRGPAGVNVGRNISALPPFKPRFGYVSSFVTGQPSDGVMMKHIVSMGLPMARNRTITKASRPPVASA